MTNRINLDQIKAYFENRIQEHGASPRGSDWNGQASQNIRFDQLLKLIDHKNSFTLLDYGCGYGAFAEYLENKQYQCEYVGFDISEIALEMARKIHQGNPNRKFVSEASNLPQCDYLVASGIFNFREAQPADIWMDHIINTLNKFNSLGRHGFAVNFLTKYSDPDKMRDDLYYADPTFLFDHCKRNFSKNVALLHDYQIYDFTLIVRKD